MEDKSTRRIGGNDTGGPSTKKTVELKEGEVVAEPVKDQKGNTLALPGVALTARMISALESRGIIEVTVEPNAGEAMDPTTVEMALKDAEQERKSQEKVKELQAFLDRGFCKAYEDTVLAEIRPAIEAFLRQELVKELQR